MRAPAGLTLASSPVLSEDSLGEDLGRFAPAGPAHAELLAFPFFSMERGEKGAEVQGLDTFARLRACTGDGSSTSDD